MSNSRGGPLSVSERIALLSNILYQSWGEAYPDFLLRAISSNNINPSWDDVILPEGRSVRVCRDYLTAARSQSSMLQLSPYGHSQYTQAAALANPTQKRSFSEFEAYQPSHRPLQPAPPRTTDSPVPPTTNGESLNIVRTTREDTTLSGIRKKRGRPSKEEAAERDRALAAEGRVYEPRKKPSKKPRPSLATPILGAQAESEAVPSLSSRASTPPQIIEPREDTSSSKRRSRRQREDQELAGPSARLPPLDTTSQHEYAFEPQTQSPSDRLLARHNERVFTAESTKPERDDAYGGDRPST